MTKPNENVGYKFMISAIWVDVMRKGQSSGEDILDDRKWWNQYEKEVKFAFRVLVGLGLASSIPLSEDKNELDKIQAELEADGQVGVEDVTWKVRPSKTLMSLYRTAIARYLQERDKRLSPFGKIEQRDQL
jgi:hypothetical protein